MIDYFGCESDAAIHSLLNSLLFSWQRFSLYYCPLYYLSLLFIETVEPLGENTNMGHREFASWFKAFDDRSPVRCLFRLKILDLRPILSFNLFSQKNCPPCMLAQCRIKIEVPMNYLWNWSAIAQPF